MENDKFIDLNQFEMLELIGSGAFSVVYKVKENETGKHYAAKVLNFKIDKDSSLQNEVLLLLREVNLISSLDHPAILKFIGFSPTDFEGFPFPTIVTELAPNDSLEDIIKLEASSLSPKGWDDTRKLINIYGIASGLQYLHLHDIIHRDMKPANILLDDYLFPKIADFGLSKITTSVSKSLNLQSQDHFKGTPVYMAPEILKNENYSKSVDVYAFAIIVYQILTGITPYADLILHQLMHKVVFLRERPELTNDIPEAYRKLIEKCWSNNPAERPTFDKIVDDLKNNEEYLTDTIDKDEFYNYVDYIDEYKKSFDLSQSIHFDEIVNRKGKNTKIQKVTIQKKKPQKVIEREEEEEKNQKITETEITASSSENIHVTKNRSKSLFSYLRKDSSSDQPREISFPIDEFNKLDKSCQDLVNQAKNDPEKQFIVGRSLVEGKDNFPKDIEIGVKYLEKSVTENCTEALIYYCQMLVQGTVIPSNVEKAKKYLKKSQKESQKDARVSLLYGRIMKKEKNFTDAKKSFEKSAKLGNKEAMYEYAKMTFKGEGCKKNDKEALKYFELSQRNGFEKADNFIVAYERINKQKSFSKLKGDTQFFLISQVIKSNNNNITQSGRWKQIYINPDKGEMLYSNGSLKSSDFLNILNNFEDISIQINFPSKSLESFNSFVSKFKASFDSSEITLYVIVSTSVSTIKQHCFKGLNSIAQVSIPSTVTSIEDHAFEKCSSLTQILVPFSVNSIGEYAFVGCTSMKQASIISCIETIPNGVFSGCSLLSDVSFLESVTKIGNYAFYGCSQLQSIFIPSSVFSIGSYAFYECSSLLQVSIPASVCEIGPYAFSGCLSLASVSFADDESSSLAEISEGAFAKCAALKKVLIPRSVLSIGKCAFMRCSSLESLFMPPSVTAIGENAFARCSALTNVSIPSSVTRVGEGAFIGCSALVEISIPSAIDLKSVIGINDNVKVTKI